MTTKGRDQAGLHKVGKGRATGNLAARVRELNSVYVYIQGSGLSIADS